MTLSQFHSAIADLVSDYTLALKFRESDSDGSEDYPESVTLSLDTYPSFAKFGVPHVTHTIEWSDWGSHTFDLEALLDQMFHEVAPQLQPPLSS